MAGRNDSIPERLGRLYVRFDRRRSSDHDESGPNWKIVLQLVGLALALTGIDAVWTALSEVSRETGGFVSWSTTTLDTVLPVLVGVTVLAVCVCIGVIAVSLRDL